MTTTTDKAQASPPDLLRILLQAAFAEAFAAEMRAARPGEAAAACFERALARMRAEFNATMPRPRRKATRGLVA